MNALIARLIAPLRGIIGIVVFIAIWEWVGRRTSVSMTLFPPPSVVFPTLIDSILSGELFRHILASGRRAAVGFSVGAIPAVVLGIATARFSTLSDYLDPLLQMLRSIPPLALVPFGIFWLGIDDASKIVLIAWAVFFPIWLNTDAGVRQVSPLLVRAAASLGSRGPDLFFRVYLFGALPYIFTGLKIALSAGISTLVAAELAGAIFGVGYLIQVSQQVFRVDLMFVGLIVLAISNWLLIAGFDWLLSALAPWYNAESKAEA